MATRLIFDDRSIDVDTLLARDAALTGGLHRMDVQESDVIGVLLCSAPTYIDVMHIRRIVGCYSCPINWHLTPAEVEFLVRDSGAKVLIDRRSLVDTAEPLSPARVQLLRVDAEGTDRADGHASWFALQTPHDGPIVSSCGYMAYTSGIMGRSKDMIRQVVSLDQPEVHLQKAHAAVVVAFDIMPGCRTLVSALFYHSTSSPLARQAAQTAGLLVMNVCFDALCVFEQIEHYRIDTVYLVLTMYVCLLKLTDEERSRYDLSSLRFVASTGAPCASEAECRMIDWLDPVIYEMYTSSKTGMITVMDPREAAARPDSAGRPMCDVRMRILHEGDTPCSAGEIGLIYSHQPVYPDFTYRDSGEARSRIERGGLVTLGDMGHLDASGCLYVCDRASGMVISGDVSIYPAKIEHALLRHSDVADCVVFGVPCDEYGERFIAVVQIER